MPMRPTRRAKPQQTPVGNPVHATCQCGHEFKYDGTQKTCPACGPVETADGSNSGGKRNMNHHKGKRIITGTEIYFPNRMEYNYYLYLMWLESQGVIREFVYQPAYYVFPLPHGINRYRPDFLVTDSNGAKYVVEVKGWMDAASKTKLNRMAKYFPHIEVRLVMYKDMQKINRSVGGIIEGWER